MNTIYMMIGIPGSGKTTYTKIIGNEKKCQVISTDIVRQNHPDWEEKNIWPEVYFLCAKEIKEERDAIFDATSITPKVRKRFFDNVDKYDVKYNKVAYFIDTDYQICEERVKKRNEMKGELFLPIDVIYSYSKRIIPPLFVEGFNEIYSIKNYNNKSIIFKKIDEIFRDELEIIEPTFDNINNLLIEKSNIKKRIASRSVCYKNDCVLYEKYLDNNYKLPGGGVKNKETIIETAIRETVEESGVIINNLKEIGYIEEYGIDEQNKENLFYMISYYFKADIVEEGKPQSLDEYEENYKFEPVFLNIKEIEQLDNNKYKWSKREKVMLKYLCDLD